MLGVDAVNEQPAFGGPGALAERMGITLAEAAPERVVGTMPVEGNTQPYGLLHGGASRVLAEIMISDDAGRRVCTARLTCLLRAG